MKAKLLTIICIFPLLLNAQEYNGAIGIRGGENWGANCRFFSDENNAVEALLSFRARGMQFTVLKEKFIPVLLDYSSHIFLYKGYGGHLGYSGRYYNYYQNHYYFHWYNDRPSPLLGADFIIGTEYRFYKFPFTFSLEYKPYAEFGGHRFFKLGLLDFGITLKYTFNK